VMSTRTVCVADSELLHAKGIGKPPVASNSEGTVSACTVPFERHTLTQLRESGRLSPGAGAALELAWRHRGILLCD